MAKNCRLTMEPLGDEPSFYYDYDPDLLRTAEAAAIVGVSSALLAHYADIGLLTPHATLGRKKRLYSRWAVEALRDRRDREKTPRNIWPHGRPLVKWPTRKT